jgi:hypothetical protein
MSLLHQEILIQSIDGDVVDVLPRGHGCYSGFATPLPDHDVFLTTRAAGFTYKICGRCGSVQIGEDRR